MSKIKVVELPAEFVDEFDKIIEGKFSSRVAAVQHAMRLLMDSLKKEGS